MDFSLSVETKIFNKHITDFNRRTNVTTEKVIKKFAFDLLARIIRKTPVDTGRARGGWFPALEGLAKGSMKSVEFDLSGKSKKFSQEAFEDGKTKGQFIDHTKGFASKKWVELINGVEYIIFLEYGWSQQAPYGMVRLSMREMSKSELPKNMIEELQKDWKRFSH